MTASTRPATPEDLPLLLALMHEFHAESGHALDRERAGAGLSRLLGDPSLGRVWLLLDGGEPAGYAVLSVAFRMEHGGPAGAVDDLFVRPAHRGRGLGSAALAALLAECRRRAVPAVHVEVGPENEAARALYGRFGFHDQDRRLLAARLPEHGADPP